MTIPTIIMKQAAIILTSIFLLQGCGVFKKRPESPASRTITVEPGRVNSLIPRNSVSNTVGSAISEPRENSKINAIVKTALSYAGVRYKYGGASEKGMDCSGLVHVAFNAHDIPLPRLSYAMAEEGKGIAVGKIQKGDLLFFRTSAKDKRINHVGLVVEVQGDEIRFIHASTSRGVIVSSLREGYWNNAFVKATRLF